jgi:uncharacterized membrane protein
MNYNRLKKETDLWVGENLISAAQAEKILARYSSEVPAYKRMSFWLKCVAGLLGGLAFFLVISENWQHMGWLTQSLVAALPLLGAHIYAIWQEKKGNMLAAEVAWLLASLGLGANIMLQAQIFHISAYYPNGVLFWVIGILPVVLWRVSAVNFFLASVLFFVYLMMQLTHNQFSFISLLPLGALAWFTWSRQHVYTVLPLLWIVYMFLATILEKWGAHQKGIVWDYTMLIFATAFLQQFNRLKEDWLRRILCLVFGFTAFLNMLLTFSFFAHRVHIGSDSVVALVIVAVSLVSLLITRGTLRFPALTWLTVVNILAVLACVTVQSFLFKEREADDHPHYFMRIAANLAYLGSTVFLLFRAIRLREKSVFMISVGMFLLWALIRYIDLFKNYLITALIFALSALALILLNRLWEKKYEK